MTSVFTIGFYVDSVDITRSVIDGTSSLGGSESACLGLARALKRRGHDVHVIATKLDDNCEGPDATGLVWHPAEEFPALNQFIEWDVFCVLRMYPIFQGPSIRARLRLIWNQDLLTQPLPLMASMWAVDQMVYVSEYQRRQYEDRLKELKNVDVFVTKNGFDPAYVPQTVTKDPNRLIHISRPERGLRPLLEMWPEIRKANPRAELRVCRYSSMYDAQGWGRICAQYDAAVEQVNTTVGGVIYIGELGKARLYQEIAEAAVMWYPGVADFAETSCIAAIESQACGTPFVGSFKGALPETVPHGILVRGSADDQNYRLESIANVLQLMQGCRDKTFAYRQAQKVGREHVKGYTYDVLAGEWEARIAQTFRTRYETHRAGILRQFLHEDDHVAAKVVAEDILIDEFASATAKEADEARGFCLKVIAGKDQSAENYAAHALEPLKEVEYETKQKGRLFRAAKLFEGCTHVLDVACGSGGFAVLLAQTYPEITVTGIDYAEGNIAAAKKAAEELGVSDRCTFVCGSFWNFDQQEGDAFADSYFTTAGGNQGGFDGAFIGEFLEHVAACDRFIDFVETFLQDWALVVYTCPHGPFTDLLARGVPIHRGHVHQFCHDDLDTVLKQKKDLALEYLTVGISNRGQDLGHWLIRYRIGGGKARSRNLAHRTLTARPMPRLSVGLIVGPNELDLRRCLDSIWGVADEIVIGDCGMGETEQTIAAEFGARIVPIGSIHEQPEGFAGARNLVLDACTGEWFLWIDADERLVGAVNLRRYLDSGPYIGYALHQNHLMLDAPQNFDAPVRMFKRRPDIQFYGCVHEQPQIGGANGEIMPALELHDVQIAHTGYLIEPQRREKMLRRNLPLLVRDQKMFPDRRLGRLLWLRDFVNLADYERERAAGELTPKVTQYLRQTVGLFEQNFSDPTDKYYALARPWYERALQDLGIGVEVELSLAGRKGGLKNQHAKAKRVWIRKPGDLDRLLQYEMKQIHEQWQPPALKTDPFIDEPAKEPESVSAGAST